MNPKSISIPALLLIICTGFSSAALPGYRVHGRFLFDRCGQKVALRGINEMVTWSARSGTTITEIGKTGANCVRIVSVITDQPADLDKWIGLSLKSGMIPMPESHSATGDLTKLNSLFDFWTKPGIAEIAIKYEKDLLLNIGNEVGDGNVTAAQWVAAYSAGIKRMREAGIHACLVVDAPSWGQNIDLVIAAGPELLVADPDQNILFSVHAYWPPMWGWTDQKVKDKIQAAVEKNIPFIFGEFGNSWELTAQGAIPYKLILEECQSLGIGWLAWSWGPGNNPQTWLDMTSDGTFKGLQDWGLEVSTTLPTSIKNTSVRPNSLSGQSCPDIGIQRPSGNRRSDRLMHLSRNRHSTSVLFQAQSVGAGEVNVDEVNAVGRMEGFLRQAPAQ
jgi:mannan endo-1,4-beta-mannosidase